MVNEFRGRYRFLSNFWRTQVLDFPTLEHAYQAAKCACPEDVERIRSAKTPGEAKALGKRVEQRTDFQSVKLGVMRSLLMEKFRHPVLRKALLATGDEHLVEGNRWGDTFWGVDLRTG